MDRMEVSSNGHLDRGSSRRHRGEAAIPPVDTLSSTSRRLRKGNHLKTLTANGKTAGRRAMVASMPRIALAVTICIGVAIPALVLSLSTLAGRLAAEAAYLLAACCTLVAVCVLAVSLSHLAWAICDITHSPRWAGWLLAVACDLSIVLAECVLIASPAAAGWLAYGLLLAVTACSMLLNCWAFCRQR